MQIINSSLISIQYFRKDIKTICVPANELAEKINSPKLANMVILGAFIKVTQILPLTEVKKSLNDVISIHYMHLKTKNEEALELGFDFVQD
ncbi:2-oxoacid:acceptor oxidoreductase family protein [Desulfovibrio litoralis]|uniref:Pyruvate ferredoxin/flavodoxin oxidoreductase n=1 Tax=Desulfovibrio litoralis DSM 11393 TaxID=1121455 RepID=A0A1M7SF80_9BACT|nr:2-oxoacid:acceptor oxidoreductase family protein [Desulfovibrio litoralis]SHN57094.1 Pyruvate ferredoxin/flavodoxin oxidoreductase [Desulfovibrio litoralis DSM 11393]